MSPAKRKAAVLASGASPESKRRRVPSETPASVRDAGSAVLTQLKDARDKRNRSIVTHFMSLPDRDADPAYYERIALPFSINSIQDKLDRLRYPSLSALESDLKRLIANAKSTNERTSEIHSDAEKVRKLASTLMQRVNPAYADRNYVPVATPLPAEQGATEEDADPAPENDNEGDQDESKPAQQRLTLRGPSVKSQDDDGPASESGKGDDQEPEEVDDQEPDEPGDSGGRATRQRLTLHGPSEASQTPSERITKPDLKFEGKAFQTAQGEIVQALMTYENEDGLVIATPFMNLPSREMKEYYQVIKQPVSLKAVMKSVRGIRGRDKPTGVSFYKYWQSFEEDIQRIWNNARTFNEDESEIVQYAAELEDYFKGLLASAKRVIPGPPAPHITFHVKDPEPSPKIKISLGSKAAPSTPNGIAVDSDALKRQKDMVRAGINGSTASGINGVSSSQLAQVEPVLDGTRARSQSGAPDPRPDGTAPGTVDSPNNQTIANGSESDRRAASTSMPPPSAPLAASHANSPQPTGLPVRQPLPPDPFQSRVREPGKGIESALIQEVRLHTPSETPAPHFQKLRVAPSPHTTHNGVHAYLDRRQTHLVLEVKPFPRPDLIGRVLNFAVLVNDVPVQPLSRPPAGTIAPPGYVWVFTLDSNCPVTQRIHVLCSSTVGRGPGMGTVEDRELRWFHIDYWPS